MFGTFKRQRGFTFTLLRGKEKVLSKVALMFIGYNLGRTVFVIGADKLIKTLKKCCLPLLSTVFRLFKANFTGFKGIIKNYSLNCLQDMRHFNAFKQALFHSPKLSLQ